MAEATSPKNARAQMPVMARTVKNAGPKRGFDLRPRPLWDRRVTPRRGAGLRRNAVDELRRERVAVLLRCAIAELSFPDGGNLERLDLCNPICNQSVIR